MVENKEVVLGNNICRKIDYLIKNKNLSKTEFAKSIKKTPSALNKILHDLRKGNISLKNLIIISDGLEIEIEDLFKCISEKDTLNIMLDSKYIQELINNVAIGSEFELKELLNEHWQLIDKGERIRIGKTFLEDVKSNLVYKNIKFERIKSNRHALYKRI